MEKKDLRQISLVRDEVVEVLPKSKPIGITATATTERRNGESVVRFAFGEKDDRAARIVSQAFAVAQILEGICGRDRGGAHYKSLFTS